ncbi:hypothetical protein Poly51_22350 [Rubripirellula tenax]|uniref:DUF2726 domain-containing protein n=1 Tax=Rubripirellula tenax TaxID=2528015 RepID=A0A5C6FFC8_9BACT|nr:DUF2726 domain-containing protein [Rubripirellula tenax]TWU59447.1 hypothetical protein Poly51_22350 [Rubripirellula tenax]
MPNQTQTNWVDAVFKFIKRDRTDFSKASVKTLPIERRSVFLSAEEIKCYQHLVDAVNGRAIICPKTRVSDVVQITNASANIADAVRLNLKRISFLVVELRTGRSVCAVQVGMLSGRRQCAQADFLRSALETVGVPTMRIELSDLPSIEAIRAKLLPLLDAPDTTVQASEHLLDSAHNSPSPPKSKAVKQTHRPA